MRRILVIALLGLLAAAPAKAAATVTFGADLSLTPDLSFRCPLPPPFFGPYTLPDTCTAFTAGVFGGGPARASHLVPDGSGVITKIRLREPNVVSSPLKLTVLRALRTPQSTVAACCTVTSESSPFTPNPNAVTEITFNPPIPVHAITTATGVYEYEAVALTATDANSVIPAATAAGHSSGAYYPAALPGQERYEDMTSLGTSTQILFEADWEPVDTSNGTGGSTTQSAPGGTTATPGPAPATPAITPAVPTTRPLTVDTTGGRFTPTAASVPLVCRLTAACQGTLLLQSRKQGTTARAAAAKTPKRPTSYGSAPFTIAAGKTAKVRVKLSKAGRALVRHQRAVTLYADATIGYQVVSVKVKLKQQK